MKLKLKIFIDITEDVEKMFDTSNYPENHESVIKTGLNKKVIGMMKDECRGKQIEEFVGLRAKLYSYKMYEDKKEQKRCKGIKKNVIKNEITFEDYTDCLFSEKEQMRKMNLIRHQNHELYTESVEKMLSSKDDKIDTLSFGHYICEMINMKKYLDLNLEILKNYLTRF